MPAFSKSQQLWAVLLAGGDGTRLRGLTRRIAGDSRPKQFCRIFGDRSLLDHTRARVEPLFHSDRELFVVTQAHEAFYSEDLRNSPESCIVTQPLDRGSGVAIAVAVLHILELDPNALVAVFPSDHYYSDDDAFARTIRSAIVCARQHPDSIVLLGAEARYPETEYGWIEPGPPVSTVPGGPFLRVNRFWHKPSLAQARALLRRGCLWNTSVAIGQACTFLELLCSQIPDVVRSVAGAHAGNALELAYGRTRAVDFSGGVLAAQPHRLLVLRDAAPGWTDLGNPARVVDALVRNGARPAWLDEVSSLWLPPGKCTGPVPFSNDVRTVRSAYSCRCEPSQRSVPAGEQARPARLTGDEACGT